MSEMNVTRRNFLSGAALVSAAIAGAGLAGCAPQSAAPAASSSSAGETLGATGAANSTVGFDGTGTLPWLGEAPAISDDQVEEELTADVVVVGLGTSGLVAASAAAKEGAKVIGLDRSASMGATNAAMVSGVWAVESSPELQYDNHLTTEDMFDFIWTSTHYQTNAPLLRNVLPASGKGIDLMIEGGVTFMFAFEGADENTLMLNRGGHIYATSGAERAEALQGMLDKFGIYYLIVCFVGIVCAIVCPYLYPLRKKPNTYLVEGKAAPDTLPEGYKSNVEYGMDLAMKRVAEHKGIGEFFKSGAKNACSMWFGVLPSVMAIGTVALILANYTPIFEWLGIPFRPLLQLLQVPEADAVASTMIVGFTDMLTPAILIAECTSEMARFIVAVVSVTQVLYPSEVGGLILGSKLPLNIWELFVLFLERTIISLLIVCPIAHLLF